MQIPDPDGTLRPCPHDCGLMTVEAQQAGHPVRVHCGTWSPHCPR